MTDIKNMLRGYLETAALLSGRIKKLEAELLHTKEQQKHALRKRILTMSMMLCDCVSTIEYLKKHYLE